MKAETREVFVADDGTVFSSMDACQAHERTVADNKSRIANLKVWAVSSGFDSTEGRGYHRTTYIITDSGLAEIIEYCLDRFGRPLSGWYGDGYFETWRLHQMEITADDALKRAKGPHGGVGLSAGEADLVFLSEKDIDHPSLPKRVFPWPKPPKGAK